MKPQTIKAKKVGKYVVLSNGEIWNMNWHRTGQTKKVSHRKRDDGYLCCMINRKSVLIHRIIAECFLPNPNNLPQINHINEIKDDNRVDNLEWCNHKYNINYGTCKKRRSEKK